MPCPERPILVRRWVIVVLAALVPEASAAKVLAGQSYLFEVRILRTRRGTRGV